MTEEEMLEIIKIGYQDHQQEYKEACDVEQLSWNDGAMFGVRFALISLGYEIDFEKWEE